MLHPAQHPIFRVHTAPERFPAATAAAAAAAPPPATRARTVMDASGRLFSCAVPALPSGGAGEALPEDGSAKQRQAVLDALAGSLQGAGAACASRREGYWSYEACLGLGGSSGSGDGGGGSGGSGGGSVRQWHSPGLGASPVGDQALGAHAPSRDALEYTPRGARYLAQHFEGGAGGRSAEVRWVCARSWPGAAPAAPSASAALAPALELLAVAEAPPLHYTLYAGSRSDAVCELLPSPEALLAPFNTTCVEYAAGGWWTYELCLGGSISQYHLESGSRLQGTALGHYDWRHGERLVKGGEDVPVLAGEGSSSSSSSGAALAFAGKPTSSLTQLYVKGSPCDVRGGMPRSALVRFECAGTPMGGSGGGGSGGGPKAALTSASFTLSLVGVEESPTCFYTFTVSTSLVCEHPSVGPASALALPPPVHDLLCTPVEQ